ncbi:MAG: hypothetical protein LC099_09960 [Anaerolineales bacterium]|nr:hypothetical protein [Anaerolineales bacterium]
MKIRGVFISRGADIIGAMKRPFSQKPQGQPTRGKTADNRLRRADNFILLYESALLTRADGAFADSFFVDLGYGFNPRTTLESAERFRKINPDLKILGVEIDKERVEAALPFADEKTFFRLGGFNLPLQGAEKARLIRAFNVLRQYEEKDFVPACERLAEYVLRGGLLLEGTSTPFGNVWAANLARKTESAGWAFEALIFSTNFHGGFTVEEFQTILPKNFIHRMNEGELIYDFFQAWKRAARETSATKAFGAKNWFVSAAAALSKNGFDVNLNKKWLNKGYLIWRRNF